MDFALGNVFLSMFRARNTNLNKIVGVTESKMPSSSSQVGTSGGGGDNNEGIHASVVVAAVISATRRGRVISRHNKKLTGSQRCMRQDNVKKMLP